MLKQLLLFVLVLLLSSTAVRASSDQDDKESSVIPSVVELKESADSLCAKLAEEWTAETDAALQKRTEGFVANLKHLPTFLNSIEKTHWYVASVLRRRIADYRVCFLTGETAIPAISAGELNSAQGYQAVLQGSLVGYVDSGDFIYLHKKTFESLPPEDQARLWMVLSLWNKQAYGEERISARRRSVNQFMKLLVRNEKEPLAVDAFEKALTESGFGPEVSSLEVLNPLREKLEHSFDAKMPADERQSLATELLISSEQVLQSNLWPTDFQLLIERRGGLQRRLRDAVRFGDLELYRKLIELGANKGPRVYDRGEVFVDIAIRAKKSELALEILKDPNARVSNGWYGNSTFHSALKAGYYDVAEKVLDRVGTLMSSDLTSYEARQDLTVLVTKGQFALARKFLKLKGIAADTLGSRYSSDSNTAFLAAVEAGNMELVDAMLAIDESLVNSVRQRTGYGGEAPISVATRNGDLAMVRRLLSVKGIALGRDSGFSNAHSPVTIAVLNRNLPILEELVKAGATIDHEMAINVPNQDFPKSLDRPLRYAIVRNDLEMAAILMRAEDAHPFADHADYFNLNHGYNWANIDEAPYSFTAARGQWKMFELLSKGKDQIEEYNKIRPFHKDKDGNYWSLLALAIAHDDLAIVKGLVEGNEPISPKIIRDWTVFEGNTQKKFKNYNAMSLAKVMNRKAIAEYLEKYSRGDRSVCLFGWCPF